jgi:amino acid adenylation domain-containing protein
MIELYKRISNLTPKQRELLEYELKKSNKDIAKLSVENGMTALITKVPEREYYAVSSLQQGMYILNQMEGVKTSYNMPVIFQIEGDLQKERLELVFQQLIKRHEALRTSFIVIDGELFQQVHREVDFKLEYLEANESEVTEVIVRFIRPFDLNSAPLLRVGLISLNEHRYLLVYDLHHIISDGSSLEILKHDFVRLYNGETLPELRIQYKDFAAWQQKFLNSELIKRQESYWLDHFAGELPVIDLPTDYPRPPVLDFNGNTVRMEIDRETTAALKKYSLQQSTTLFTTLFAAYNVFLARLTGQEELIIGVPITGRDHTDLQNTIGVFVKNLVLRNYPQFETTFETFLGLVREQVLRAFENGDYPFERLLEKLAIKRELNRNPLYDTVFNYNFNYTMFDSNGSQELLDGSIKFTPYLLETVMTKFDITVYVEEIDDKIGIAFNYRTSLFRKTIIEYLINQYLRLLKALSLNPGMKIKEYPIFRKSDLTTAQSVIPAAEYEPFPEAAVRCSIGKYFETQVVKYSDQVVIKALNRTWTYRELNAVANRIAWSLLNQEVSGQTVALLFEHGAEMIAAVLGVLKAGSIYVPLDPDYPFERQKLILEDSQALHIITNGTNLSMAQALNHLEREIRIINIDNLETPEINPAIGINPEDLAYVIYTSGSTGKPKGVTQTHRNIIKFAGEFINLLHLNRQDRLALFTSYSHTVAVIDIFSALFAGAVIYPYDVKYSGDMAQTVQWLKAEQITIYHSVPTVFRYCADALAKDERLPEMRMVVIGGEAVRRHDVESYREHFGDDCLLVNLFGSSELLIATAYLLNKETVITKPLVPIGYPIPGVEIDLLNEVHEEVGVYRSGELIYRSEFVSPGYWRLEKQTRTVFERDEARCNVIVYHSGDRGRRLPSGELEYSGRQDQQVKIRGFRIELNEVESVLETVAGIKQSAVIAQRSSNEENILIGYYAPLGTQEISAEDIRRELHKKLPEYMIPVRFVSLAELPLTPNGKINRQALPEQEEHRAGAKYEAPRNAVEAQLVAIWQEVLEIKTVGIRDNFFDLGGHSINAMQIIGRLTSYSLGLMEFFKYPTIAALSNYLQSRPEARGIRHE